MLKVPTDGSGPLRLLLEATAAEEGIPLKDLTVLAVQNDPFRLDTPAGHRDGAWLAMIARDLGYGTRKVHLRGLHYAITTHTEPIFKPNGERYVNDDANWLWMQGNAAKAARWLGYLPFDQVVDQRNTPPIVRIYKPSNPRGYLTVGLDFDIPPAEEIVPSAAIDGFTGDQPYKLVLIGEKSSLEDVLGPVASEHKADLYLPTGEISDTLIYQMARIGAEDGRPMIVLYFSDCDPSGWQMPISVGRKLQACKVGFFPDLDFREHRVAVTPDQVREYGLPSTPLKEKEKRGDAWQAAWGTAQTEIDAFVTPRLAPTLRRIARAALAPFFDATLDRRVFEAQSAWLSEAQTAIDEQMTAGHLARIHGEAEARLEVIRAELDALNDAMRIDANDFDLPEPIVPTFDPFELSDGVHPLPLLDSGWNFAEQCRRLIESKAYRNGHHD
jgi:hypothetical protein